MRLRWLIPILTGGVLLAASVRLHLKDGGFHAVREYEVLEDRVRYYSVERSDWEEIPLDLVDLKKTRDEAGAKEAERKAAQEASRAERKAERDAEREVESVPDGGGPYWIGPGTPAEIKPLKQAETKINTNRRRSVLKAMSPIPIVAGKATLEVDGERSAFVINHTRPDFYFRLLKEERIAIAKMGLNKGNRVVEKWSIIPVTKEVIQDPEEVPTFRHQAGENLFKIWPQKPMPPGEYAFIQFEPGKANTQVWDFAIAAN
ncbi:MAG: hypothetical protein FJW39_16640 [Acidobacteria bacterium]|nr:hypothetical protein [Acidobacteriota bacterium]